MPRISKEEMKEYKLHNTDGKTFFDFRSEPNSRCEGFTISYLDDGTVVMSGDYGTLCWKRNYHHEGDKDFQRDYGFPNKETGIGYFAEKVCQFGIKQEIEEWNKEKAIADLKQEAKDHDFENDEKYKKALESIEWLEEYESQEFNKLVNGLDYDLWESRLGIQYTSQFKFMFECLKSVSDYIWNAVKENAPKEKKA